MSSVVLTLHYPRGIRGLPIATSTDLELLRHFKEVVLEEWRQRVETSGDEVEALINRLEYDRLSKVLTVLIPNGSGLGNVKGE